MTERAGLTVSAWKLLKTLKVGDVFVPYGDGVASEVLHKGLAERLTTFGKLRITEAGRQALKAGG